MKKTIRTEFDQHITIITNSQYRPILYYDDLTDKEKEDFDWIESSNSNPEDYTFFRYKNTAYCTSDFMSLHNKVHCPNPPIYFKGWDGYLNNNFFSGVLVKISNDGNAVKAGMYFSDGY